jgi:hypothetical protein
MPYERIKSPALRGVSGRVQRQTNVIDNTRTYWVHERPGIIEFLSTLKADLVRPSLNGEHAAQSAVMAAPKGKLENPS